MTKNPITIEENRLAVEAVQVIGENRIDDLVVLDEKGKPTGLVDSQDLSRMKLV